MVNVGKYIPYHGPMDHTDETYLNHPNPGTLIHLIFPKDAPGDSNNCRLTKRTPDLGRKKIHLESRWGQPTKGGEL